mmetsp:Transcript_54529/g.151275  ORF Transcript_54529/g.151275 Transcript_54529/m.151275 type:complete len:292 (+) Transcript_54529:1361-2236(+)
MRHILAVAMLHSCSHLPEEVGCLRLIIATQVVVEPVEHELQHVATLAKLQHQVHIAMILKDLEETHNVRVVHELHHADLVVEFGYVAYFLFADELDGARCDVLFGTRLRLAHHAKVATPEGFPQTVPLFNPSRVCGAAVVPDHAREVRATERAGHEGGWHYTLRPRRFLLLLLFIWHGGRFLLERDVRLQPVPAWIKAHLYPLWGEAQAAIHDRHQALRGEIRQNLLDFSDTRGDTLKAQWRAAVVANRILVLKGSQQPHATQIFSGPDGVVLRRGVQAHALCHIPRAKLF